VATHPVRLIVEDDLERSRLTVFFRLLLAIPHFVWFVLWSIASFVVSIVNWFATLILGRSPEWAHGFLAAYVRYGTHLYAYLYLAANPYPGFTGEARSYPIDVDIDPPAPQRRLVTLFRLFLALPAILLAGVLVGGGAGGGGSGRRGDEQGGAEALGAVFGNLGAVAIVVAVLAWFACLARGRMPSGFRDLLAWGVRYGAQTYSYLLLLTERYPNSDPFDPPGVLPEKPLALTLALRDDLERSRLTVFFRLLLALPHLVWATLWSYAVFFAAVAQWFFMLFAGRPALPLRRFIGAWVRYQAQVYAYLLLAANPFPGFVGDPGYPVEVEIEPPGSQRRLVTFFRFFLVFPALIVAYALAVAAFVAALLGWFASLALGRMPYGLRNVVAYVVHYWSQVYAYAYLVTERYPYSGPRGSAPEVEEEPFEPEAVPA
jgi:hypothetical protein